MAEKVERPTSSVKKIRWLRARKWTQAAAGLLFLAVVLISQRAFYLDPENRLADLLVNVPLYLDPLAMVSKIIASRTLAAVELLFILTIILTLLFGRVWCGWFCPLGSLQDWLSGGRKDRVQGDIPGSWRKVKYGLLGMIIGLAVFSNLSWLVLDPLTIIYRSLSAAILPAVDKLVTVLEKTLLGIKFLRPAVSGLDSWIRPGLLPYQADLIRGGEIFGLILLLILLLNYIVPRFFCRYLCPLGGLLGLLSRFSWFRVRIDHTCSSCTHCVPACPTGAIIDGDPLQVQASECIMCMTCPTVCPTKEIEISPGKAAALWGPYDPDRRTALLSLGAVALGAGAIGTGLNKRLTRPFLLRPPGADEADLLRRCLRCGECSAACPTNAIQLSFMESGLEGLWTPVLVPRIGHCDLSCNACGQVCPAGAIPFLSLEDKKEQVIGKAYLNTDRCIAWADGLDCVVCEEMCPLPEKAITLEKRRIPDSDGELRERLFPVVDRARCIGCGVCENKCPLSGEAAIRVYVPPANPSLYIVI